MSIDTNASTPPKPRGWRGILRPRKCSRAASERVLSLVRNGHGLREIAARNGMPTIDTLCRWIEENKDFAKRYGAARRSRDEMLADEAVLLKAREMKLRVAMLKRRIEASPVHEENDTGRVLDPEAVAHLQAVLDRKLARQRGTRASEASETGNDA